MIDQADVAAIIRGTALDSYEVHAADSGDHGSNVLILGPIPDAEAAVCLATAREMTAATGRWPFWVCDFGGGTERSTFWRSEFAAHSPDGAEVTPSSIAQRALEANEAEMLRDRLCRYSDESIEFELVNYYTAGSGPALAVIQTAIDRGEITHISEWPRWVLDWRLRHGTGDTASIADIRRHVLDYWHEEGAGLLFFLPTRDSWRAAAYWNFFGAGGELATLLLKKWFDKWGARVIAHSGTMMNFEVAHPPATDEDVAEVAWEHELLAPATTALSGTRLVDYAIALRDHPRWSLHEKP